jgi:hypothetical protein
MDRCRQDGDVGQVAGATHRYELNAIHDTLLYEFAVEGRAMSELLMG